MGTKEEDLPIDTQLIALTNTGRVFSLSLSNGFLIEYTKFFDPKRIKKNKRRGK